MRISKNRRITRRFRRSPEFSATLPLTSTRQKLDQPPKRMKHLRIRSNSPSKAVGAISGFSAFTFHESSLIDRMKKCRAKIVPRDPTKSRSTDRPDGLKTSAHLPTYSRSSSSSASRSASCGRTEFINFTVLRFELTPHAATRGWRMNSKSRPSCLMRSWAALQTVHKSFQISRQDDEATDKEVAHNFKLSWASL